MANEPQITFIDRAGDTLQVTEYKEVTIFEATRADGLTKVLVEFTKDDVVDLVTFLTS